MFTVTAELLGAIASGALLLATIAATVQYVVAAQNSKLEVAIEQKFAALDKNIKEWVNGSFMRSKEVGVRLDGLSDRIENIETNGCARRADHE